MVFHSYNHTPPANVTLRLFRDATILKGFHVSNLGVAQHAIMIRLLAVVQDQRYPTNRPKYAQHDPRCRPGLPIRVGGDPRPTFLTTMGALFHHHGAPFQFFFSHIDSCCLHGRRDNCSLDGRLGLLRRVRVVVLVLWHGLMIRILLLDFRDRRSDGNGARFVANSKIRSGNWRRKHEFTETGLFQLCFDSFVSPFSIVAYRIVATRNPTFLGI